LLKSGSVHVRVKHAWQPEAHRLTLARYSARNSRGHLSFLFIHLAPCSTPRNLLRLLPFVAFYAQQSHSPIETSDVAG